MIDVMGGGGVNKSEEAGKKESQALAVRVLESMDVNICVQSYVDRRFLCSQSSIIGSIFAMG